MRMASGSITSSAISGLDMAASTRPEAMMPLYPATDETASAASAEAEYFISRSKSIRRMISSSSSSPPNRFATASPASAHNGFTAAASAMFPAMPAVVRPICTGSPDMIARRNWLWPFSGSDENGNSTRPMPLLNLLTAAYSVSSSASLTFCVLRKASSAICAAIRSTCTSAMPGFRRFRSARNPSNATSMICRSTARITPSALREILPTVIVPSRSACAARMKSPAAADSPSVARLRPVACIAVTHCSVPVRGSPMTLAKIPIWLRRWRSYR